MPGVLAAVHVHMTGHLGCRGDKPQPPPPGRQADLPLFIYLQQDTLTLYRDMSGRSLHNRDYRSAIHRAGLNAAAAAGILLLAGWPELASMSGAGLLFVPDTWHGLHELFRAPVRWSSVCIASHPGKSDCVWLEQASRHLSGTCCASACPAQQDTCRVKSQLAMQAGPSPWLLHNSDCSAQCSCHAMHSLLCCCKDRVGPMHVADGATLADPMCGSGTLLIEAALMATHTAPGLSRTDWPFRAWPEFDPRLWEECIGAAADAQRRWQGELLGCDSHPGALSLAKRCAGCRGLACMYLPIDGCSRTTERRAGYTAAATHMQRQRSAVTSSSTVGRYVS